MNKNFKLFLFAASLLSLSPASAQNTSPYWSLAGNSNATTASKLGTTNPVSLRIYSGNVQRMVIAYTTGNVGVGTTSVTHRLTVGGNGRFTTGLLVDNGGLKATNKTGVGITGTGTTGIVGNAIAVDLDGGIGVVGNSTGGGIGVVGNNNSYGSGVEGYSRDGWAIVGASETNVGVEGQSKESIGVDGLSLNSIGVNGSSSYGTGVQAYSAESYGLYSRTSNTASYAGYFVGNVYATGTFTGSDETLKQDIADMSSAMDIIGKLKPKSYSFKQEGDYKGMNLPAGKHYGLIAQEVEQVLPDLVKATKFNPAKVVVEKRATQKAAAKELSFKALNYTELIPIVIKGMQELNQKSEELATKTEEIDDLKNQVAELRQMVLDLKNGNTLTTTSARLEQNSPNPVSGTTIIRYQVPQTAHSARLTLTNAKGQLLKEVTLGNWGAGQLSLNTTSFAVGTYSYTLWVDDIQAGSKRLVIAR